MRNSITNTYGYGESDTYSYSYCECNTYRHCKSYAFRTTADAIANCHSNRYCDRDFHGNSHAKFNGQTYAYPAGYTNAKACSDTGASPDHQAEPVAACLTDTVR